MILVDTSIWVEHLRKGVQQLSALLYNAEVLGHQYVTGELACGNLQNRTEILDLLERLPQARVATHSEVLFFIGEHRLMGHGIGYIDAHLLAATALTKPAMLWSKDRRLNELAGQLGIAHSGK